MANIMSKKLPAFQLYPGDWLKDPRLSMCSLKTRGAWIDLICAMHELDRSGSITGDYDQLARICRCTSKEILDAIDELVLTKTASVTHNNGRVTVINRRMKREYNERLSGRERQAKFREKTVESQNSNVKVTTPSSVSSSSSSSKGNNIYTESFIIFWNKYPRKQGKKSAFKSYKKCGVGNDILLPAIDAQLSSKQWEDGYIPNPAKWLNQGEWENEVMVVEEPMERMGREWEKKYKERQQKGDPL